MALRDIGRRTCHHETGALPRSLSHDEGELLSHPLVPESRRLLHVTVDALGDVTGDATTLRLREVRLHPHHRVQQALQLPAPSSYALFSHHWSLANAAHTDVSDLPMLLRAVADQIEADAITVMELLDVVVHQDIGAQGPTWTVTV